MQEGFEVDALFDTEPEEVLADWGGVDVSEQVGRGVSYLSL